MFCTFSFEYTLCRALRLTKAATCILSGAKDGAWVLTSLFESLRKSHNDLDGVELVG